MRRYEKKQKMLKYSDYCSYLMLFFYVNAIIVTFPLAILFSSELIFWTLLLGFGYMGIMCMALSFIFVHIAYNN